MFYNKFSSNLAGKAGAVVPPQRKPDDTVNRRFHSDAEQTPTAKPTPEEN